MGQVFLSLVYQILLFFEISAETKSQKPARIHSPDPFLRAGNSAEVLPNPFPQKIVLAKPSPYLNSASFSLKEKSVPRLYTPIPKKENWNRAKTKEVWAGCRRGRDDTAEAEGQPLRAVVEWMLGRGGIH